MSDPALRPLSGLELARAALLGLSIGVVAAPLAIFGDLPELPQTVAPLVPAWLAWTGSLALFAAVLCLALPRLRGKGRYDRNDMRGEVGLRLSMLSAVAGALAVGAALMLSEFRGPGAGLLTLPFVPVGAMLGGAIGAGCLGGLRGRGETASWGAGLGCFGCVLTLGTSCLLVGLLESPLGASAGLALPLLVIPALTHTSDVFDESPRPL